MGVSAINLTKLLVTFFLCRASIKYVCGEVRVFFAFICTYLCKIRYLIGQKYDAMRCISLIGLYITPDNDVDSVGRVFYFYGFSAIFGDSFLATILGPEDLGF